MLIELWVSPIHAGTRLVAVFAYRYHSGAVNQFSEHKEKCISVENNLIVDMIIVCSVFHMVNRREV